MAVSIYSSGPARGTSESNTVLRKAEVSGSAATAATDKASDAHAQLLRTADAVWDVYAEAEPIKATLVGDTRFNASVPDRSAEGRRALSRKLEEETRSLAQLDQASLGFEDRVILTSVKGFVARQKSAASAEPWRHDLSQMNIDVHADIQNLGQFIHTLSCWNDVVDLNTRFEKAPQMLAQRTENLRDGMSTGDLASTIVVGRVLRQLDQQLESLGSRRSAKASPYLQTLRNWRLPEEERSSALKRLTFAVKKQWASRTLTRTLQREVAPALHEYARFLREDYVGRPPEASPPGLAGLPDGHGRPAYEHHTFSNTGAIQSPEELHQRGLTEVEHLQRKLRETALAVLGEAAPPNASLADLIQLVQNHESNRFETHAQARQAVEALIDFALDEMSKLWGIELPEKYRKIDLVEDETYASGAYMRGNEHRNGTFYWNPKQASSPAELASLVFHEVTHHLQWVASMSPGEWPELIKNTMSDDTMEGQGLRAESMALEAGLYEKAVDIYKQVGGTTATLPLVLFGTYSIIMMRAARLVVDTGLHHDGWSRQQAIDFMKANCAMSPERVEHEVDRYIGLPGQALSYRVGEVEQLKMLEWAKQELGDRYDSTQAHSALIRARCAPLNVVKLFVEEYVRKVKAGESLGA